MATEKTTVTVPASAHPAPLPLYKDLGKETIPLSKDAGMSGAYRVSSGAIETEMNSVVEGFLPLRSIRTSMIHPPIAILVPQGSTILARQ